MSTGSALLDMYLQRSVAKTASSEKTAEEVRLEKLSSVADNVFDVALNNYLCDFAANDLSR